MKKHPLITMLFVASALSFAVRTDGDQFLDGIGETALIARYLFDGNLQDRSRNSLHASMEGAGFLKDKQFRKALCIPYGDDHVRIPGPAVLSFADNLTITGWIKTDDCEQERHVFNLGIDKGHRVYCILKRADEKNSVFVTIGSDRGKTKLKAESYEGYANKWMHIAFVLNASTHTQSLYVNGHPVDQRINADIALQDIFNRSNPESNYLLIGGSVGRITDRYSSWLHDLRFYKTALSDEQIGAIHHNALQNDTWGDEIVHEKAKNRSSTSPALLLVKGLRSVEDIEVVTSVGQFPRLPAYLPGIYDAGTSGPEVRVVWPSPQDNAVVLRPGKFTIVGRVPGTNFKPEAAVFVKRNAMNNPPQRQSLTAFPLGQVALNPGAEGKATLFMKHRDKFLEGLAKTNPDSFLYNFRDAFGQPHPDGAEPLLGWDSQTCRLRGHASGHYLTAIAQAFAGTGCDPELNAIFKEKMDTMVEVLYELSQLSGTPLKPGGPHCADPVRVPPGPGRDGYDSDLSAEGIRADFWNWGDGFVSGYPPDQFIMLERGASYGTGNDQIWAPYYSLDKILTGLMDCYEVGENPKALEVAKGMGLWVYRRLDALPEEIRANMWSRYIAGEYGGMTEAMARLNKLTGDQRFLECATLFDNTDFFFGNAEHWHGLACNIDTIRGRHANQHIPQIIGALEIYKGTRDPAYYSVAENFWDRCIHSYMYSIGGVAGARNPDNAECFTAEPDTLFENGLSEGGQNETCATYNLLKLGRQLFMFEPKSGFMDYYERALYNHILASVAEHDGGNTYHVPLNPGAVKSFGNARMNSFSCCNGTALESATKLQNTIYMKSGDNRSLYVNLYIASSLEWKERGIRIIQNTDYPYSDTIKLTINGSGSFSLHLRIPEWVKRSIELKVNGKPVQVKAVSGRYLELTRIWENGDTLELTLPMDFYLMPLMDRPNIASLFYGPVMLAAEEPEPRSDWRALELDPSDINSAFTGEPSALRFESAGTHFKPFFETYDRYSVYLDIAPKPANAVFIEN